MTSELLQQARVLDPVTGVDRVADILIEDNVIREVANEIDNYPDETTIHNCQGLVLGPGLVDLYSHSGEPGFEERETLESLMLAAAAGGFTRITVLPDTVPPVDSPAALAWIKEQAQKQRMGARADTQIRRYGTTQTLQSPISTLAPSLAPLPSFNCWAALTINIQGQQMTELGELATTEIVGFADGKPLGNRAIIRRLLEYLKPLERPVALWAWDAELAGNGVMREGQNSIRFGLPGVPAIAETSALSALLECIEATGTPVHLMRVSTARGVDLIRSAKSRGVPVTASTLWTHLLLNSEAVGSYDPNLRLTPPLGNLEDQIALLEGLQEGTLDAIAIDHTPYTYEEKTVPFAEAPPGTIGLELALPLLWQSLVETNRWSALELWRCLSNRPAQCLTQKSAAIAINQPAELTLFDPNQEWVADSSTLKSLSANTPWLNQEIKGRVVKIWCR